MRVAILTLIPHDPTPPDILDYFREKDEIIASGDWDYVTQNFLDKIQATNNTAHLTENGLSFIAHKFAPVK